MPINSKFESYYTWVLSLVILSTSVKFLQTVNLFKHKDVFDVEKLWKKIEFVTYYRDCCSSEMSATTFCI